MKLLKLAQKEQQEELGLAVSAECVLLYSQTAYYVTVCTGTYCFIANK